MGLFYLMATPPQPLVEPAFKRAVAFIDGQNLFHHAHDAFGHHWPNYDIQKLCEVICKAQTWNLTGVRFYTGVPDASDDPSDIAIIYLLYVYRHVVISSLQCLQTKNRNTETTLRSTTQEAIPDLVAFGDENDLVAYVKVWNPKITPKEL